MRNWYQFTHSAQHFQYSKYMLLLPWCTFLNIHKFGCPASCSSLISHSYLFCLKGWHLWVQLAFLFMSTCVSSSSSSVLCQQSSQNSRIRSWILHVRVDRGKKMPHEIPCQITKRRICCYVKTFRRALEMHLLYPAAVLLCKGQ